MTVKLLKVINLFIRTRGLFFSQNLRTIQPQQKSKGSNFQFKYSE